MFFIYKCSSFFLLSSPATECNSVGRTPGAVYNRRKVTWNMSRWLYHRAHLARIPGARTCLTNEAINPGKFLNYQPVLSLELVKIFENRLEIRLLQVTNIIPIETVEYHWLQSICQYICQGLLFDQTCKTEWHKMLVLLSWPNHKILHRKIRTICVISIKGIFVCVFFFLTRHPIQVIGLLDISVGHRTSLKKKVKLFWYKRLLF